MSQAPVIWLTGISGSGKSTIALAIKDQFAAVGRVELLDGDEVRNFFEGDLGYLREERKMNVRRIAFCAQFLAKNGVTTIVANIAPYYDVRDFIRRKIPNYIQIFCKASLEVVADRDVQGHYAKYKDGEMANLVGLDDQYDVPRNPDLVLDTGVESIAESLERVREMLFGRGIELS